MNEQEQYPEQYEQKHYQDMNVEAFTNESALRMRLDSTQLKYQIQLFLEGKIEKIVREEGILKTELRPLGTPMVNDEGVQRIMSYIESVINSQVVQGNLKLDQYEWFMQRTRKELAKHIFVNMYRWGIREQEFPLIVDMLCSMIELFVSRLINNEERKSYANFMSHFENGQAGYNTGKKSNLWQRIGMGNRK